MIKSIVFDIGGVLIDFSPEKVLKAHGLTGERLDKVINATTGNVYWKELDRGVMNKEDVVNKMKEGMGDLQKEIDWFFTEGIKMVVAERKYAVSWITSFKKRGLGIYLLSNYPVWAFEMHKAKFSFLPLTDGRIVSAYEKVIKPERAIYELLLSRFGLKASECIFIDDVAQNVIAARDAGMKGVQFTNFADTSDTVLGIIEREV